MKQGGRLPPEKKRKTKICRFLYENIRNGFFVEEKMSRITIVRLNEKFFEKYAQCVEILKKYSSLQYFTDILMAIDFGN